MTICPCCGYKFVGDLRAGCPDCGARAVGEPLARPEHELPFYGRALLVATISAVSLLSFAVATLVALLANKPYAFDFWTIIAAAETAAWKAKWLALPLMMGAVWLNWRVCAGLRRDTVRFMGQRVAHGGLAATLIFSLMMLTLLGVTVPERLRQRQRGIDAAFYAQGYTIQSALLEYRARYGTLPAEPKDLLNKLPDPDGSLAKALANMEQLSYKPSADLASLPKTKTRKTNGIELRRVSLDTSADDVMEDKVSFTNYELRLPGEDKILGTDDDWMMRDGVIQPADPIEPPSKLSATGVNRQ